MKLTVNVPEPKFKNGDVVTFRDNVYVIGNEKRYHIRLTQEIRPNDDLLGTWQYDLSMLSDNSMFVDEYDIKRKSPNPELFTVCDTHTHAIMFETKNLRLACRWIMTHDKSDGWYDYDIQYNGYNDMHVMDCIDALLIVTKFYNGSNDMYKLSIDDILSIFQYNLNNNKIHYCMDYEQAYDFASVITQVDMKDIVIP